MVTVHTEAVKMSSTWAYTASVEKLGDPPFEYTTPLASGAELKVNIVLKNLEGMKLASPLLICVWVGRVAPEVSISVDNSSITITSVCVPGGIAMRSRDWNTGWCSRSMTISPYPTRTALRIRVG